MGVGVLLCVYNHGFDGVLSKKIQKNHEKIKIVVVGFVACCRYFSHLLSNFQFRARCRTDRMAYVAATRGPTACGNWFGARQLQDWTDNFFNVSFSPLFSLCF